jgi:biopolymer transport protein ExbB
MRQRIVGDQRWWKRARVRLWCYSFISAILTIPDATLAATTNTTPAAPTRSEDMLQILGNADLVVKTVLLLLVIASITSWALLVIKSREIAAAKAALSADLTTLNCAPNLGDLVVRDQATAEMIEMARAELALSGTEPTRRMLQGVEERVNTQLPMIEARAIHRMLWGTNVLASIGSVSPFVGLAGTVWGIMNSFLNISRSQSTSLAVVAPGIAEALIATAVGLVAAIPAVLIYNGLARSIAGYRRQLTGVAVLTACIISREAEARDIEHASTVGPAATVVPPKLVRQMPHSDSGAV